MVVAVAPDTSSPVTRLTHSHPLTLAQLRQLARNMDDAALRAEFATVPLNLADASTLHPAWIPFVRIARYFPHAHARVKVASIPFINASFIPGPRGRPDRSVLPTSLSMQGRV